MKKPSKILAYLFGSLGDSIVAIPAFRALRRSFPNAEIVLLEDDLDPSLVRASDVIPSSLIDRSVSYRSRLSGFAKIRTFYELFRLIKREKFDAAAYLVISERSARAVTRDRMFFRSCGIRSLYGFKAFDRPDLYPIDERGRPATTDHEAVRKLKRLYSDEITPSLDNDLTTPFMEFEQSEIDAARSRIAAYSEQIKGRKLFAIAPGCKTIANQWPVERFINIGQKVIDRGGHSIVVFGGKAENDIGDRMTRSWGEGINLAGELSIRESAALLSLCDIYLGLDTGSTHLAAAAGTRCVGIYGERNNPGHWYPFGKDHFVIRHPVKCSGCRHQECPVSGHPCMTEISEEAVWDILSKILDDPRKNALGSEICV